MERLSQWLTSPKGRWWLNVLAFCYVGVILVFAYRNVLIFDAPWQNDMSEMFDNYEGGFVRRGLFGQLLLWIDHHVGIHPFLIISAVFALSYLILTFYFVRHFRRGGYCWYFLLSCLMVGSIGVYGMMMRRMFLVVLFLCVIWLCQHARRWIWIVLGNAITVFGLFCYEPYIFFSVPMFVLITHAKGSSWLRSFAYWLPSMVVFGVCCVCHGNPEQFAVMKEAAQVYVGNNTNLLDFIRWGSNDLIQHHININYLACPWYVPAVVANLIMLLYTLYVGTNASLLFKDEKKGERHQLFSLVLFQLLTQIPMFVILSTDYGRICCFSVTTSYIVFFSLDAETKSRLFPVWAYTWMEKACEKMNRLLRPTPLVIIFLLLFIGNASWQGNIGRMLDASMVGRTIKCLMFINDYLSVL